MTYSKLTSDIETQNITHIAELTASYSPNKNVPVAKLTSSDKVQQFIRKIFPVQLEYREAMVCVYLNRANTTIGYSIVSIGGVAGTICDPKIIFQTALLCHASAFILCHNHPSGNLKPSRADIQLTEKIKHGGELLDIMLLDHIILTADGYLSFADEALL